MSIRPDAATGNAQTEWLVRRLLNPAENVDNRRAVAQALARTTDPRGLLALTAALDDPDAKVHQYAQSGLTAAGWGGAQRLLPLMETGSPDAELAARALGIIGDRSALEALMSAQGDIRPAVAADAVIALGYLGEPSAVEPLCALLTPAPELVEEAALLRRYCSAARALGTIGDPRAVDTLCRCLHSPEALADAAAQALGAIRNPWATEPLIAALTRIDPYDIQRRPLRITLCRILGLIADPRVIHPLCQALSDGVPFMRHAAAASLYSLSDALIREGLATHDSWMSLSKALLVREDPIAWQAVRAAGLSSRPELLPELRKPRFPRASPLVAATERGIAAIERATLPTHPIPAFPPENDPQNLPVVARETQRSICDFPLPSTKPGPMES